MSPIAVIGVVGGEVFGAAARHAVGNADVVVGSLRHATALNVTCAVIPLTADLDVALEQINEAITSGRSVVVLASGDPGFFGIVRLLRIRFGSHALQVFPAPSSISLAWAKMGQEWDGSMVVSAHGRSLQQAVAAIPSQGRVAVLTAPGAAPHDIARALIERGDTGERHAAVASQLGEPNESVNFGVLRAIACEEHDAMSVLLLQPHDGDAVEIGPTVAWGTHEENFARRGEMITKREVRAVALGTLELNGARCLWDIGAGSGSVGVEAASVYPTLRVCAVERVADDAANVSINADRLGVSARVTVIVADALAALRTLPAVDRIFVGGGGPEVLLACWHRLDHGGRLVATFTMADRAAEAYRLLGNQTAVRIERARSIGDGFRFEPLNPVFVCWGDKP